ncbi:DUF1588 domain-containing protein [Bradyrhizobium iriomotense]|uniref:DUF1592 domain-containing protein n=1 Tax=Bradyrhizobium iriomotense TaxID=441950 RepID=A0ABQ6BC57_9BRAD|nr:DUF1588 domain-containing protein [Bradyrhizobium iriomotense]GLR90994.1 hypothetical protein GCM10007857_77100 [Bradyrhizobium iriomotense]
MHRIACLATSTRVAVIALGVIAALALAGCYGPTEEDGKATAHAAAPVDLRGAPQRMRLITRDQYVNSLRYIFGPDLSVEARIAPMRRTEGLLANAAASVGVTDTQIEQFQRVAVQVSAEVVDAKHRNFFIPCKPKDEMAADPECAATFLSRIGRLLYRRPLSAAKLAQVVEDANVGAAKLQGFYPGLAVALEGVLLSPELLFVTDTYEPDPQNQGQLRLDAYSLAQRMSFFLWNAAPDEALLKAADSGEIQSAKGRARVVDMMLASPRLEVGMRAFFGDMMEFNRLDGLAKDPKIFPAVTAASIADAREQTLRTIINHLITENRDYRDLYTTRETFISPSLAALYGTEAAQGWGRYEFPGASGRVGIVTHISFLAVHAHPVRSSPTLRGKAVREILLCQKVPPPPPNVDFSAIENPDPSLKTARDRLEAHRKNPVCAGCHKITDPIGLALENFDGAGEYREAEKGAKIDVSGTLDGKPFNDAVGFAYALHDNPALTSCLVRRLYSYGTGGPATAEDAPNLAYFNQRFGEQGYRLRDLLRTIALSRAFSQVLPPVPVGPIENSAKLPAQNVVDKAR